MTDHVREIRHIICCAYIRGFFVCHSFITTVANMDRVF